MLYSVKQRLNSSSERHTELTGTCITINLQNVLWFFNSLFGFSLARQQHIVRHNLYTIFLVYKYLEINTYFITLLQGNVTQVSLTILHQLLKLFCPTYCSLLKIFCLISFTLTVLLCSLIDGKVAESYSLYTMSDFSELNSSKRKIRLVVYHLLIQKVLFAVQCVIIKLIYKLLNKSVKIAAF